MTDAPLELTFDQPAAAWEEALPVGNGRLGAMVPGGYPTERIGVNEDSFWSGPVHALTVETRSVKLADSFKVGTPVATGRRPPG